MLCRELSGAIPIRCDCRWRGLRMTVTGLLSAWLAMRTPKGYSQRALWSIGCECSPICEVDMRRVLNDGVAETWVTRIGGLLVAERREAVRVPVTRWANCGRALCNS